MQSFTMALETSHLGQEISSDALESTLQPLHELIPHSYLLRVPNRTSRRI